MVGQGGLYSSYCLIICSLLLLSSCSPALETPWTSLDLRLLDPLDAPDPALDLIAVYTRSAGLEDHIRLDFLDVPETPAADIFIALDTQPGGNEMAHLSRLDLAALYPEGLVETDIAYDLLLVIPAEGEPGVIDVAESTLSTRLNPRIVRDPALDTLTVVFNRFDLPADYSLQVFVTPAAEHAPADQTAAISSDCASRGARQSPDGIFKRLRRHHPRSDSSTLGRRAYRSLR